MSAENAAATTTVGKTKARVESDSKNERPGKDQRTKTQAAGSARAMVSAVESSAWPQVKMRMLRW